jgi:hypothetical protein
MTNTHRYKVSQGVYSITISTAINRGYQVDTNTVAQDVDGLWYVCSFSFTEGLTNKVGDGFRLMRDAITALQKAHSVKVAIKGAL